MTAESERVLDELIELYQHMRKHTTLTTEQAWQTLQALKDFKRLALRCHGEYQKAEAVE